MKYVINSKGEAVILPSDASVIRLIPQEIREKELSKFAEDFSSFLHQSSMDIVAQPRATGSISVENKHFCFLMQPFYTMEHLIFFTKTEFSSSSQAVKTANELEKHPEILANREYTEFFKSIFPDNSSSKPRWYLMCVGAIAFERNLYDCKCINAEYIQPVPYAQFMRNLEAQLTKQKNIDNDRSRFQIKTNGMSLTDIQSLLATSFDRDIVNGSESRFDLSCLQALEHCKQIRGYVNRDSQSNKATICLSIINDSKKNVFLLYQEIKNCIKKTFKSAYNVRYKGNRITAQINEEHLLTIYVGGTDEKPQLIIGGNTFDGMDSLKAALLSPSIFQETKWFTEKVKPYIQENEASKPKRKRDKDEIGWNKKRRQHGCCGSRGKVGSTKLPTEGGGQQDKAKRAASPK